MKRLNYARFVLLLILTLGLGACGDDVYYTDDYLRNSDEKLCGKTWSESYDTDDGRICVHQLIFSMERNRSGKEIFQYYRNGESKPAVTTTYNFNWAWMDSEMEGLVLDRGAEDIHYFDNVWVRQNYLSGKLDGIEVTFIKE
ncbi:hypothetical protein [Bacteroides sp.]